MQGKLVPVYGGPRDGEFLTDKTTFPMYKLFLVRGRQIWLYKSLKIERVDFNILHKAASLLPSSFDLPAPDDSEEQCKPPA